MEEVATLRERLAKARAESRALCAQHERSEEFDARLMAAWADAVERETQVADALYAAEIKDILKEANR